MYKPPNPSNGNGFSGEARVRWPYARPLLLIVLLGAVLRLLYWQEIVRQADYRYPGLDAGYHDYWARSLVTGNWTPPPDQVDPRLQTNPYFRPPGYSFWLAAVYRVLGLDAHAPRIAQFSLGLLSIVLTFLLASRWLGNRVGLLAAAFTATYWILIYYEGELLEPPLLVSLGLGLLLLLSEYARTPRWGYLAGGGALLGLYALVRPNILIFGAMVPLWLWWLRTRVRGAVRPPFAAWGLWVGLAALMILPATIRNYRVSGEWVLISSNGGINLLFGQEQDGIVDHASAVTGHWNCFDYPRVVSDLSRKLGRPLTQAQASDWFGREAIRCATSAPLGTLRRLWLKTLLFWGPHEVCTQEAEGSFRSASRILRWTPLGFPFVLGFALTGVGLFFRRPGPGELRYDTDRRNVMVLILLFIGSYFASYVPFIIGGAYRVPLIPVLLILAAYAIDRLAYWIEAGRRKQAVSGLAMAAGCWVLAALNYTGYQPNRAHMALARAISLERAGDFATAETEYRRALEYSPTLGLLHNRLGVLLARAKKTDEALLHFQAAAQLDPEDVNAHFNLGLALALRGRYDEAVNHFEKTIALKPEHVDAHFNLGLTYTFLNRNNQATAQFQKVLTFAPGHPQATDYLQRLAASPAGPPP